MKASQPPPAECRERARGFLGGEGGKGGRGGISKDMDSSCRASNSGGD